MIRKATIKDIETLAQMNFKFQISEKEISDRLLEIKDINYLKEHLKKQLKQSNFIFIVAEEEGMPVGFMKGLIEEESYYEGTKKVGYPSMAYVDENYREKKIGEKMLDYLIDEFKKSGVDIITAFVNASNKKALKLVNKKGFDIQSYEFRKILK